MSATVSSAHAPELLLNISAAARAVGLPRSSVVRLIDRRAIPHIEISNQIRVRLSDVRGAIREIPATA